MASGSPLASSRTAPQKHCPLCAIVSLIPVPLPIADLPHSARWGVS
jgi:hypothetical protein